MNATRVAEWSEYRDPGGGNATVREAIGRSPYCKACLARLAAFTAKANQHETVRVSWWHAPFAYVTVTDSRKAYPYGMRALTSFDLTNGRWSSCHSARRYVFARRGWRSFLEGFAAEGHVPLYGEETAAGRTASMSDATGPELIYEGHVRYADGSVVSTQCAEGRCCECPDESPGNSDLQDGPGPLEGDWCERDCGHGPGEARA